MRHPSAFCLPPSAFGAIRNATLALTDAGEASPRLTAEVLLAHVLGVTRTRLLSRPEQPLASEIRARFEGLVARAAAGEPLAYLTGCREFYGLDFVVDTRALVPRPETELLIDLGLSHPHTHTPTHILDVGTGSGCLAVTLAVHCPSARLTAVDLSADALGLARLNARRHGVSDRITFLQSDLLSFCLSLSLSFDLLCANLPYLPSAELPGLPFARFEPGLALDGGPDGLDLIRRLLAEAPRVMASGGCLLLEINDEKAASVCAIARAAFPRARVIVHKDLAGLDRVVAITL